MNPRHVLIMCSNPLVTPLSLHASLLLPVWRETPRRTVGSRGVSAGNLEKCKNEVATNPRTFTSNLLWPTEFEASVTRRWVSFWDGWDGAKWVHCVWPDMKGCVPAGSNVEPMDILLCYSREEEAPRNKNKPITSCLTFQWSCVHGSDLSVTSDCCRGNSGVLVYERHHTSLTGAYWVRMRLCFFLHAAWEDAESKGRCIPVSASGGYGLQNWCFRDFTRIIKPKTDQGGSNKSSVAFHGQSTSFALHIVVWQRSMRDLSWIGVVASGGQQNLDRSAPTDRRLTCALLQWNININSTAWAEPVDD